MSKLFNQIRGLVLDCQDTHIKDMHGRVEQVGMGLGDDLYIMTNSVEEEVNSLYINKGCDQELVIQETDAYALTVLLEAFEQLELDKKEQKNKKIVCPRCENEEHRKEARFCVNCGLDIRAIKAQFLLDELQALALPIIQHLEKYYDPHCEVVIRADGIRLNRTELSIPALHPDVKKMIDRVLDV